MKSILEPRIPTSARIRWALARDLEPMHAIERAVFPYPLSLDEMRSMGRRRNVLMKVIEIHGVILGYMTYELCPGRIDILNIAVRSDAQRCGLATALVHDLIRKLHERRKYLRVIVREGNLDAQLFFRRLGFLWVKTERDHWDTPAAGDAYVMEFWL